MTFFQSTAHLIEQCPALSPSKRRPKVPQVSQPSPASLQLSSPLFQEVPQLSSSDRQVHQPQQQTSKPSTLTDPLKTSLTQLSKLSKMGPTQHSETGKISSDGKAQAGMGALQKVSECAQVPTSEGNKSSTFSGGASASPDCSEDFSPSSAIELPNEGRLDLGTEFQRIGTDQICEEIDKSPPKEGEENKH